MHVSAGCQKLRVYFRQKRTTVGAICTEQTEPYRKTGGRTGQLIQSVFKIKHPVLTRDLQHNKVVNIHIHTYDGQITEPKSWRNN